MDLVLVGIFVFVVLIFALLSGALDKYFGSSVKVKPPFRCRWIGVYPDKTTCDIEWKISFGGRWFYKLSNRVYPIPLKEGRDMKYAGNSPTGNDMFFSIRNGVAEIQEHPDDFDGEVENDRLAELARVDELARYGRKKEKYESMELKEDKGRQDTNLEQMIDETTGKHKAEMNKNKKLKDKEKEDEEEKEKEDEDE